MRATTTIAAGSIAVLVALGVAVGVGVGSGSASTVAPVAAPAVPAPPVAAAPAAQVAPAQVAPAQVAPAQVAPAQAAPAQAAPAPAAPATVPGIPCSLPASGDGACVSLSKQRAWLIQDGKVATSVPVKTGKNGATTPTGRFSVLYKDIDHWSKEFDAAMPYSVFFYPGDAFHTGSLSQRSNGCVHLSNAAAKQFYSALSVGDPVQVVR